MVFIFFKTPWGSWGVSYAGFDSWECSRFFLDGTRTFDHLTLPIKNLGG